MSKSNNETIETKEVSRDTLVDWGALLSFIAAELDICVKDLTKRRRRILEVRQAHFPSDKPGEEPTSEGLESLASALGSLEWEKREVVRRFNKAKAFRDMAKDALHYREEEDCWISDEE